MAYTQLVGTSSALQQVQRLIDKLAPCDTTVLVSGESGTGKELVARALHVRSARAAQPFVPINCAALSEELLESELFGHVKGAFTGAVQARLGRFQLAHGGTLFLDEIGEMQPKLQVKLLRVLQERCFEPVGSDRAVTVDVRVVAATNQDLGCAVREGTFREDLFYRLHVVPIVLPPLRERQGDIRVLGEYFLGQHGVQVHQVEAGVWSRFERYGWPGNVRELENVLERLVVLHEDGPLREEEVPEYIGTTQAPLGSQLAGWGPVELPAGGVDLNGVMKVLEGRLIEQALVRTQGNKTLAADLLRLNRTTLIERLRKRRSATSESPSPADAAHPAWQTVRKPTTDAFSLTT